MIVGGSDDGMKNQWQRHMGLVCIRIFILTRQRRKMRSTGIASMLRNREARESRPRMTSMSVVGLCSPVQ